MPATSLPPRRPIITLLTDFGTSDGYVGAMKGAILSIQPEAEIVDISHDIPAHDVRAGAFVLKTTYRFYPRGTIHVAIVDPGVGGERLPVLLVTPDHFFIGPDNGIFSWIVRAEEVRDCRALTAAHYMRESVSQTFHGRDIFGPAAAWLARGAAKEGFGEPVGSLRTFGLPETIVSEKTFRTEVIHVDRFGNCVLGTTRDELERAVGAIPPQLQASVKGVVVTGLRETYDGGPSGAPFFLFGSTGHLEIAAHRASAAGLTRLARGDSLDVSF